MTLRAWSVIFAMTALSIVTPEPARAGHDPVQEACYAALKAAGDETDRLIDIGPQEAIEAAFRKYETLLDKGCSATKAADEPNQSKLPPDQCPSPWRGVSGLDVKGGRWGFFDKVAMPILFPDQYNQPALSQPLSVDAKIWLVLQAKMESANAPGADWNIFNNQYDVAESVPGSHVATRLEYVCANKPATPVKLPAGWEAFDPKKGKWLCPVSVRVPTAAGPVAALNNDLTFLKQKFPGAYQALTASPPDFDGWLNTLGGYGTSPKYRNKATLRKESAELAKDLDRYLAQRQQTIADASQCKGQQAVSNAQLATLAAARSVASAIAKLR
jgi:hypothetical protein